MDAETTQIIEKLETVLEELGMKPIKGINFITWMSARNGVEMITVNKYKIVTLKDHRTPLCSSSDPDDVVDYLKRRAERNGN